MQKRIYFLRLQVTSVVILADAPLFVKSVCLQRSRHLQQKKIKKGCDLCAFMLLTSKRNFVMTYFSPT